MRAPSAVVAVPLLAGCVLTILGFDTLPHGTAVTCGLVALLALTAAIGSVLQGDVPAATVAIALGAGLAGLSLGASAADRAYRSPLLQWFEQASRGEPVVLEGELREDAAPTPAGVSLTMDVRSIDRADGYGPPIGGVRVSVGGALAYARLEEWRAGRRVRLPATLRLPSTYYNPGAPDERRALARRGIVLVGTVKSAALVEVVRPGSFVAETAAAIRAGTRARVHRLMGPLDPASAGVTTAVLIGDRSGLGDEDERRLQEAGTYHVIAISGGNIAVLAVLLVMVQRLLMVPARTAAVFTALALVFYGIVAAGAASVSRAVTVAALVLAARALDHRGSPLNALGAAGMLAAAHSPTVALDPGFVLSFGATLGILIGVPRVHAPRIARVDPGTRRWAAQAVVALGAATIAAEAVLMPIGATLFGRVPLAGLVLNYVAIPLMTVVQIGGLAITVMAGWWDAAAAEAAFGAHLAARGLLQSARLVDLVPSLVLDVPPPAAWLIVAYYLSLTAWLWPRSRRAAALCFTVTTAVMLVGPRVASADAVPPAALPLRVVILDVGQGDATVVLLPGGRTLLVDAGGLAAFTGSPDAFDSIPGFDVGERVVWPAMRALGVRRVHGLVLTHGDPDHALGVPGVLRHVAATAMWEGVPVPRHRGLKTLSHLAEEKNVAWRTVQPGDVERFGGVEVRVLHPPLPAWERQRVRNDDSVVLEIRVGEVSVVLPGDIGTEGERAVAGRMEPGRLVILKAPHHGSATSSTQELLDSLRPAAVIFSCGRDNRFGHPHPSVVTRYRAIGSRMFSTAEDGAVFVETDGATAEIRGWLGRRAWFSAAGQNAN